MDDERTIECARSRRHNVIVRRDVDNLLAMKPSPLSAAANPAILVSDLTMLDKLHPSWRREVRELLEELTLSEDVLDRVLALEALEGFDAWEAEQ